MARKDKAAGELLRRLRTDQGHSPETLATAVRDKGIAGGYSAARVTVSGDLIRLIERTGHEPGPRIKFALAFYFDYRPGQIWKHDALVELPPPAAVPA
jgi:hypothetical protein